MHNHHCDGGMPRNTHKRMTNGQILETVKNSAELKALVEKIVSEKTVTKARWKPEVEELYFFVASYGGIDEFTWKGDSEHDSYLYSIGNCFKTMEEAESYKERLIIKQELEDLAMELNDGVEIDWKDRGQWKYSIYFDSEIECFHQNTDDTLFFEGSTYCLSENFLEDAKKRIGEDRLLKLFKKGER
jgi:hypothetical protein